MALVRGWLGHGWANKDDGRNAHPTVLSLGVEQRWRAERPPYVSGLSGCFQKNDLTLGAGRRPVTGWPGQGWWANKDGGQNAHPTIHCFYRLISSNMRLVWPSGDRWGGQNKNSMKPLVFANEIRRGQVVQVCVAFGNGWISAIPDTVMACLETWGMPDASFDARDNLSPRRGGHASFDRGARRQAHPYAPFKVKEVNRVFKKHVFGRVVFHFRLVRLSGLRYGSLSWN